MKSFLFYFFKLVYSILAPTPLRHIPGMLALSNIIFRSVWPKGDVIEVQGQKMYVNIDDPDHAMRYTFQAYCMNLVHEEETTKLFRQVVRPGDVVLDLGANIGYFTTLAGRLVGPAGKVISFEPEPNNFRYLKRNIELNKLENIEAYQKAVSNANGSTKLFICSYDSGHHTINQLDGITAYSRGRKYQRFSIDVDMVRIDDFISGKISKVDVIKMDVEGAEALAVEGMRETLRNNDVKVFLEYFPLLIKKMGSDERRFAESLLSDFGFVIYVIGRDYAMAEKSDKLVQVENYEQLARFIVNKDDHVNLYLTKHPIEALQPKRGLGQERVLNCHADQL